MENELAVYDEFIQQLKQFQASDAELVFDVETPDGEADCRAYHKKLRKVWNRVNDLRLDTSKIYREKVDNINAEGNGILAEIDAIANPRKALLDTKEASIQAEIDAIAVAADVKHQTNIHLEITESLSGYTRNAANADMLMAAIVDGRVPHIKIVY